MGTRVRPAPVAAASLALVVATMSLTVSAQTAPRSGNYGLSNILSAARAEEGKSAR